MQAQKRINVFSKETGMIMRVTLAKAKELEKDGYRPSSKSKLKSFLNKQRKLNNNAVTFKRLGVDINVHNPEYKYFKMPSGNVHIVTPIKIKGYFTGRKNLIVQFA